MIESYTETSTQIAQRAGVLSETVRNYDALGLLDSIRLANGVRLFKPSAADLVRQLKIARIANRGNRGRRRKAA